MANLGPYPINETYDNLLQVDGGLTNDLKPVLDGNGEPSGLYLGLGTASLVESLGNNFINVALNGVTPDKTGSENSSKMTTIIADLWESGGGSLYFPPGTYNFAEEILIEYPAITSNSSITAGLGTQVFTTNRGPQRGFAVGQGVRISHVKSDTTPIGSMLGVITAFDAVTLVVNVLAKSPDFNGTYNSWAIIPLEDAGNINVVGAGPDVSKLVFDQGSNGITFDLMWGSGSGTVTYAQNVYVRDLSLISKNAIQGSGYGCKAISWLTTQGANNQSAPVFCRIQNVKIIGDNPFAQYWDTGVYLPLANNVYISDTEITGQFGTFNARHGIVVTGVSVGIHSDNVTYSYLNYGAYIYSDGDAGIALNDIEGVFFDNCSFVPVNFGVYSYTTASVHLPRAHMGITESHINANSCCVYMDGVSDSFITNNLFFIQGIGSIIPDAGSACITIQNTQTSAITSAAYNPTSGKAVVKYNKNILSGLNAGLVTAGSFVVGTKYIIYSVGTTDWVSIGAASNTKGVVFVATGAGTGNGQALDRLVDAGSFVSDTNYTIASVGTTDFTLVGATSSTYGNVFKATGPGTGTGCVLEAAVEPFYISGVSDPAYNGVYDAYVVSVFYDSETIITYTPNSIPVSNVTDGNVVWQGARHAITGNAFENFSTQKAIRGILSNTSYVTQANNIFKRCDIPIVLQPGASNNSLSNNVFQDVNFWPVLNQSVAENFYTPVSQVPPSTVLDPNTPSWSINGTTAYNEGNVVISNTLTSPLTGATYGDLQYCSTQITGGGQNPLGGCLGLVQSSADVSCSLFGFFKTRSTTPSGVTALQANDDTGEISYHGTDGVQYVKGSIITAVMDGAANTSGVNSSMPMRLTFWTRNATFDSPSSYSNALKEAFRIDKDQNVYVTGLANAGNTGGKFAIGINVTPTYEYTHNSRTSGIASVTYYDGSTGGGSAINTTNGFSSTVPVYGFWYDENTGLGNPAANIVSVITDGTEKMRIDSFGNQFSTQQTPFSVNTTATLNTAQLASRIIRSTTAALVTGTLPTGTAMDAWFSGAVDMAIDWSVINTGATNNFVVAASTDHTVIGNMTVLPGISGLFRSRRTAANTWITYRVS